MFRFYVTVFLSSQLENLNTCFYLSVDLLFIVSVFLIYVVHEGRILISKVLLVSVAAVFVDDTIFIANEEQFKTIRLISYVSSASFSRITVSFFSICHTQVALQFCYSRKYRNITVVCVKGLICFLFIKPPTFNPRGSFIHI